MAATTPTWTLDVLLTDFSSEMLPALHISGVCQDSRLIESGDLYLALPGGTTHGMRFAEAAVANGAVAVLCSADAAADRCPALLKANRCRASSAGGSIA